MLELEFKLLVWLPSVLSTVSCNLFSPWGIMYVRFHRTVHILKEQVVLVTWRVLTA